MRRRTFLGAAATPLVVRRALAASPPVMVGLERLAIDNRRPLRGRRVGLLCHAASVAADGRHAIDVLRASGASVERLFGPEHGLRGQAAAGEKVTGGTDPGSGMPVVSLYGERSKPAPADLRGLEALVVDLQDAGVRFYTYASTMLLCLEAAAEAGIEVDRARSARTRWGASASRGPCAIPAMPLEPGVDGARAARPRPHARRDGALRERAAGRARCRERRRDGGWSRDMTWADTGLAG